MKRPVLFAFMVVCALFWMVMFIIPFFTTPKTDGAEPTKKEIISRMNRTADQTNALGFMVVSWIGVGVLWMTQRTPPAEANKSA